MKTNEEFIKIWIFFKIATGYNFEQHSPQFYAWTSEKTFADLFKQSRNMDKVFRCKVIEVTKSVYNNLSLKHGKKRLVSGGLATKTGNMVSTYIRMIMTEDEEFKCSINGEDIMVRETEKILHNYASRYIECLKPKYLNILNNLRLFEYLVYTDSVDNGNDFYSSIVDNAESGVYMYKELPQADSAAIFIALYGYMIKDGYKL